MGNMIFLGFECKQITNIRMQTNIIDKLYHLFVIYRVIIYLNNETQLIINKNAQNTICNNNLI